MTKLLFFVSFFSLLLNSKNFFLILLAMEVGVLGLLFSLSSFCPAYFLFSIFSFVMGSVTGLVLFLSILMKFSSNQTTSWYY